jgi:hypothetical protein
MGRTRVLRGRCLAYQYQGPLNLIQDDNRFNHGFIVKKFVIGFSDVSSSSAGSKECFGVLATHAAALEGPVGTVVGWNWDDRRQVAWASTAFEDSQADQTFELIDPTHIIVRDLWFGLTAQVATSTNEFVYYVELEQVELSDNQAVLAIVQEEAQDVN